MASIISTLTGERQKEVSDDDKYKSLLCKKYADIKEDDFLCLYDAIKADFHFKEYINSKNTSKHRHKLYGIPKADYLKNRIINMRFFL